MYENLFVDIDLRLPISPHSTQRRRREYIAARMPSHLCTKVVNCHICQVTHTISQYFNKTLCTPSTPQPILVFFQCEDIWCLKPGHIPSVCHSPCKPVGFSAASCLCVFVWKCLVSFPNQKAKKTSLSNLPCLFFPFPIILSSLHVQCGGRGRIFNIP